MICNLDAAEILLWYELALLDQFGDELAQMQNSNNENRYETIQVTISQDEFCRNIDNIIEDQYTLTFAKCELDTIIILISIKSIFMTFKQMYQKQI